VDGIVSTAGAARFAPLAKLTDEDFRFSLANLGNRNSENVEHEPEPWQTRGRGGQELR
jgi:hypothetical protein